MWCLCQSKIFVSKKSLLTLLQNGRWSYQQARDSWPYGKVRIMFYIWNFDLFQNYLFKEYFLTFLVLCFRVAALTAFSYLTMKWLIDALDPTRKQQMEAKERAKKLLKSIGVSPDIKLTTHEMMVSFWFSTFVYLLNVNYVISSGC